MSLAGGAGLVSQVWGSVTMYSMIQCIMGEGHMKTSPVDQMTDKLNLSVMHFALCEKVGNSQ